MLTVFAQTILAAMLTLITPGKSVYSQVNIPDCDEVCQQTKPCSDPVFSCERPQFSPDIYNTKWSEAVATGQMNGLNATDVETLRGKIRRQSFTRIETYAEGLKRYAVIAQAAAEVADEMTWRDTRVQDQECTQKAIYLSKADMPEACTKVLHQRPWVGSKEDLAWALITTARYESGFRRDVHTGVGPAARGDCDWEDPKTHKKVPPATKGAALIHGSCRSVCLGQINFGALAAGKTYDGWTKEQLVGEDLASTKRCFITMTRVLSTMKSLCSHSGRTGDWAKMMFSAYGTGNSCYVGANVKGLTVEAKWPKDRAATFHLLQSHITFK